MERIVPKLIRVLVVTLLCVAPMVTASSQEKKPIDLDALAARGLALANQDPEALELRNQQVDDSARRGFDIGMGVAEGQTLPGPGKQRIQNALPADQQDGYAAAVTYSLAYYRKKITDLAPRGEAIANEDPLAVELRNLQPEGATRLGFDIGMAVAEGQTLPGPGKQKIHDSLYPEEQTGFDAAVSFSLERNRNAKLAAVGAAIAMSDPDLALVRSNRRVTPGPFFRLGFDIATGIFGDPAKGALGNTATGPGSLGIRDSLSAAGYRGFNASVALHLSRNYKGASGAGAEVGDSVTGDGPGEAARRHDRTGGTRARRRSDSPVVTKDDYFGMGGAAGRAREAFQPEDTIRVYVGYRKELGYKGDTNAFGNVGPTSCDAFSVSVAGGDNAALQLNPIRISSDSKMEVSGDYYVCSYLVSYIPLGQTFRVSVGLAGPDASGAWKGGGATQPPPGQQRTIIIVSGRQSNPSAVTLSAAQRRATVGFEMIYAPAVR